MARNQFLSFFSFFFIFFISLEFICSSHHEEKKQVYIVYMGAIRHRQGEMQALSTFYSRVLEGVGVSKESIVRSYTKSFRGFAVYLTKNEQKTLASHDEVISVFPDTNLRLLTTQSWDFIGLSLNVTRYPKVESDTIVGVIDTGIWPASASFNDTGFGPPPSKWKGVCNGGENFTCNNKIIGARFYQKKSAIDTDGHGTHTASIVAGNEVQDANFFGIANGIARGAVPSARIAVYKVCDLICPASVVLAAFDDAISDGVDILSVSLGVDFPDRLEQDAVAIGGLHSFVHGILTVQAGGDGRMSPTSSVAPWLLSVAASSTSRQIVSKVQLGNGDEEYGLSINSFNLDGKKFPLIHSSDASNSTCEGRQARVCYCLDNEKVKGKIVLCDETVPSVAIATGSIMQQITFKNDVSTLVSHPASYLLPKDYETVQRYYNSTRNPEATIFKSELTINETAPVVARISSRGPNEIFPDILKPDITAPGVNILAAYPPNVPPSFDGEDTRSTPYNFMSGTSMACPHVAGAAAYVRSKNPNWSPSAIKSALMTTARKMNYNQSDGSMEFAFGSGFLDAVKALNPGLVYENTKTEFVVLLCNMGYNNKQVGLMFGDNTTCPNRDSTAPKDLNYPSMAASLNQSDNFSITFARTVTNVGEANSTYKATFSPISQINITVEPSILSFKELNEKKSFVVTISGNSIKKMISASLEWSDGIHIVRSPIVVYSTELLKIL